MADFDPNADPLANALSRIVSGRKIDPVVSPTGELQQWTEPPVAGAGLGPAPDEPSDAPAPVSSLDPTGLEASLADEPYYQQHEQILGMRPGAEGGGAGAGASVKGPIGVGTMYSGLKDLETATSDFEKQAGIAGETSFELMKARRSAAERVGALKSEQASETGKVQEQYDTMLTDAENVYNMEQRENQKAIQESRTAYADAVSAVNRTTVDPLRMFRSTGGMIATLVSLLAGAFSKTLAARRGVEKANPGIAAIDRAIELDVQAQEAELASKMRNVNLANNMVAQMRQKFGDTQMAHTAAKAAMYEQASRATAKLATKFGGLVDQAALQGTLAELDAKTNVELLNLDQMQLQNRQKLASEKVRVGSTSASLSMQQRAMDQARESKGGHWIRVAGMRPYGLEPPDKKSAEAVRTMDGVAKEGIAALRRAIEFRKKLALGQRIVGGYDTGKAAADLQMAVGMMKKLQEAGAALTEIEREQLISLPMTINKVIGPQDIGQMERGYDMYKNIYLRAVRERGYTPSEDIPSLPAGSEQEK